MIELKLEPYEVQIIKTLGNGCTESGIRKLMRLHADYKRNNKPELTTANQFIEDYLEFTGGSNEKMLAKHLYDSYKEFCDDQPVMGKHHFNLLLESHGAWKATGQANKLYIYNVVSNWI